jgi:TolB-like protein/DNA-binding SARP family transcriptional activator
MPARPPVRSNANCQGHNGLTPPARLRLSTLGELRLDGPDGAILLRRTKELALLAFIARRSPRPIDRAQLASLFWEESDAGRARQSLRQALLQLRRAVGVGLLLDEDSVSLAPECLELDATEFERELAAGLERVAVQRWHGDFLAAADGVGGESFRAWLEAEREGLRRRVAPAFARLVLDAREHGAMEDSVGYARRWTTALPDDERAVRALAEALLQSERAEEAASALAAFAARSRLVLERELPADLAQLQTRADRQASRASAPRTPGSAALFTPELVGRGSALRELGAAWQASRAGAGIVMFVEGEPGIGKTRLCHEFLRRLQADSGPTVLRVRGDERADDDAASLMAQLLEPLAHAPGLAGAPPSALAELAVPAPAIAARFKHLPPPVGTAAALRDAAIAVVAATAEERAVVLFADDLPLLPEPVQRLVGALAEAATPGVMVLATVRTDATGSVPAGLHFRPGGRRLTLPPLGPSEVDALLGSMLQLDPVERRALADQLHASGGGNPFFTVELVAALVDEGRLRPTDAGLWRLAQPGSSVPLPASVRDLLSRRLAGLTGAARAACEAAAVLGRTFDPALVPGVAALGPGEAEAALEELMLRKLIRASAPSPGMDEFNHDLACRAVYELLPGARREVLHARAAAAWNARAPGSAAARSALEYHRGRAGVEARRPLLRRLPRAALAALALLAAAGVVAAAVAARALLVSDARGASVAVVAAADRRPPGLAVLDLNLLSTDTADAYIAAGITDEVTSRLARLRRLRVASRRAVHGASPEQLADPAAIGRALGVRYFVEGGVQRVGPALRVSVRLVDAADGFQRWSGNFDATPGGLLALQDTIARGIAFAVANQLSAAEAATLAAPYAVDPLAYDHFLRANYHLNRRTPQSVARAMEEYQLALAVDPRHTEALARFAYAHALFLDWGWPHPTLSPAELRRRALELADRAVDQDPSSAETWLARAYLLVQLDMRHATGALVAFERALALDSTNAEIYHQYGQTLMILGRDAEAMAAYRRTIALEPLRPMTLVPMAAMETHQRRFEEARRWADSAVAVGRGFPAPYALSVQAGIHLMTGDAPGAREAAERSLAIDSSYPLPARSMLARALLRLGDSAGARRELARTVGYTNPARPSNTDVRFLGGALAAFGRTDEALDLIEHSEPRGGTLWFYMRSPDFDAVREHPRFQRVWSEADPRSH